MFTVTKIPKTPNILWDAAAGKPLCKFVNGVLKTNNNELAEKLKEMGYKVTGEKDATEDVPGEDVPEDSPGKEIQSEGHLQQLSTSSPPERKRTAK